MNEKQENTKNQSEPMMNIGYRQSAKGVIFSFITRKENEIKQLKTLLEMLPTKPTKEQDEALFCLIFNMKN